MGTAQVVKLSAHPSRTSILSFEVGGVLDETTVGLGDAVKSITYQQLVDGVAGLGTDPGDPSRLIGDAAGVLEVAGPHVLARLRAEDRRTALNSAVATRYNLHVAKHREATKLINTIRGTYGPTSPASNYNTIKRLDELANQQLVQLSEAYQGDELTGVVRSSTSTLESSGRSSTRGDRSGQFYQESVGAPVPRGTRLPHVPPAPAEGTQNPVWTGYESHRFNAPAASTTVRTTGVTYEKSGSNESSTGRQTATHTDYAYRTPYLEAQARALRARISLQDEFFAAYVFAQNVPHLEQVFGNELACIDNDVYQLQVALLRALLVSPVEGIVTGLYKEAGEAVSAGEPVLRVEDNSTVHLVGELAHLGPVWPGAGVTVETALSGAGAPTTTLSGIVTAARGADTAGRWDVVVRAANLDGVGGQLLPAGCVLDPDATTLTLL